MAQSLRRANREPAGCHRSRNDRHHLFVRPRLLAILGKRGRLQRLQGGLCRRLWKSRQRLSCGHRGHASSPVAYYKSRESYQLAPGSETRRTRISLGHWRRVPALPFRQGPARFGHAEFLSRTHLCGRSNHMRTLSRAGRAPPGRSPGRHHRQSRKARARRSRQRVRRCHLLGVLGSPIRRDNSATLSLASGSRPPTRSFTMPRRQVPRQVISRSSATSSSSP